MTAVKSVKCSGWTLVSGRWAVMISGGIPELLYVPDMIQYDGWIRTNEEGREKRTYQTGHVFLRCFRFTFKQLRLTPNANRLEVEERRLVKLLKTMEHEHSTGSSAVPGNLVEFPFPLHGACPRPHRCGPGRR